MGIICIFLLYLSQQAAVQIFLFPSINPVKWTLNHSILKLGFGNIPVEALYTGKCDKKA